jgi:hypothetical protein
MKKRIFGRNLQQKTSVVETAQTAKPKYENVSFKKTTASAQGRKVVYIRPEHHERIMRIVRVIGEEGATLFEYLDNVLTDHFAVHKDEITALYNERNKTDIF